MKNLLNDFIDMHVHGGPSSAARRDPVDLMRDFAKNGYKAFVLKDHYNPSIGVCNILNKWFGEETGVMAVGLIVLNNAVGGLNVYAADWAVAMGAKVISFPTISTKCHLDATGTRFTVHASGCRMKKTDWDNPMSVIDENGKLTKDAESILEYMEGVPDVCLYTGHLTSLETNIVVENAFRRGLKRVFINHPYWITPDATLDQIKKWADMGMYIELNVGVMDGWSMSRRPVTKTEMLDVVKSIPATQMAFGTDLGSTMKDFPSCGMKFFVDFLLENEVSEKDIITMGRDVPAYLLSLN